MLSCISDALFIKSIEKQKFCSTVTIIKPLPLREKLEKKLLWVFVSDFKKNSHSELRFENYYCLPIAN